MKRIMKNKVLTWMALVLLLGIVTVCSQEHCVEAATDYSGEYVAASKEYGPYYVVELAKVKGNKYKVQMYRYWGNGHEAVTATSYTMIKKKNAKFRCTEIGVENTKLSCQMKVSKGKIILKCAGSSAFATSKKMTLKKGSKKNFVKVRDTWGK